MEVQNPEGQPIIKLPNVQQAIEELEELLSELDKSIKNIYAAPEQLDIAKMKQDVIKEILMNKEIGTWDLARKMAAKYGDHYFAGDFGDICRIIDMICRQHS